MKKLLMIAVMAIAAISASAQTPEKGEISVTPMVGVSYGGFFGFEYKGVTSTPSKDGRIGFTAGAELGYMCGDWFKTSVGVQYINASTKFGWDDNNKFNTDYLAIPVLANFYVADGLAIKTGVQPAFLLSSKLGSQDIKNGVNSFDLSIPVGLSYEFDNIVIDARYNIGLQNVIKDGYYVGPQEGSGFHKLNNGYATITVGYKFNLK